MHNKLTKKDVCEAAEILESSGHKSGEGKGFKKSIEELKEWAIRTIDRHIINYGWDVATVDTVREEVIEWHNRAARYGIPGDVDLSSKNDRVILEKVFEDIDRDTHAKDISGEFERIFNQQWMRMEN